METYQVVKTGCGEVVVSFLISVHSGMFLEKAIPFFGRASGNVTPAGLMQTVAREIVV